MTDTNLPAATVLKAGYKTTEFWLALAAKLLGAAYAAGLIGDGGTIARIAGLAAVVLSSLGYSVSRGIAKAAAVLLLVGLLAPPTMSTSCATVAPAASAGAVAALDCEAQHFTPDMYHDLQTLAADKIQGWIAGKTVDTTALAARIEADLALFRSDAGHCAIVGALAAATAITATERVAVGVPPPPDPRAAFELARLAAGWVPVKVAGAVL